MLRLLCEGVWSDMRMKEMKRYNCNFFFFPRSLTAFRYLLIPYFSLDEWKIVVANNLDPAEPSAQEKVADCVIRYATISWFGLTLLFTSRSASAPAYFPAYQRCLDGAIFAQHPAYEQCVCSSLRLTGAVLLPLCGRWQFWEFQATASACSLSAQVSGRKRSLYPTRSSSIGES